MQFETLVRTNRIGQVGTTIGASGTLTVSTGAGPGVANSDTGTLLVTLTAVVYAAASGGAQSISATAAIAGAGGTPGHARFLSSGSTAGVEGTAGVGTQATFNTVTLSAGAIATCPVNAGGTGYAVSASIPVILTGGSPTTPAIVIATTNSSGVITGTTITYAGVGYGSAPTATVAQPFDFMFATAPVLGSNVTLTSAVLTDGNA
jgi:hypothetical protein